MPKNAEAEIDEWENDSLDICISYFESYSMEEIINKVRALIRKQFCLQLLSEELNCLECKLADKTVE